MPHINDSPKTPGNARGFTLIEMMITVAIVAILATVAAANYGTQVRKSRRTDARNAILDLAGREERYFSVNNTYSQTTTDLGYTGTFPIAISNGGTSYYSLNVATGTPPLTYTITATPTGTQTKDTACASMTLNQVGRQQSTNSGGTDSTATCWN